MRTYKSELDSAKYFVDMYEQSRDSIFIDINSNSYQEAIKFLRDEYSYGEWMRRIYGWKEWKHGRR